MLIGMPSASMPKLQTNVGQTSQALAGAMSKGTKGLQIIRQACGWMDKPADQEAAADRRASPQMDKKACNTTGPLRINRQAWETTQKSAERQAHQQTDWQASGPMVSMRTKRQSYVSAGKSTDPWASLWINGQALRS